MSEKNQKTHVSRREFLKQTLKTTGYVIPTVMIFKLGSIDVWAESYNGRNIRPEKNSSDPCNGFFEKIFKTSCWFK